MKQTCKAVYENGVFRPVTLLLDLQEGQEVVLRVEPIEKLDPAEEKRRREEFWRHMEAKGMLEKIPPPTEPKPVDFKPLVIEGEPMSETVIKMRRGEI